MKYEPTTSLIKLIREQGKKLPRLVAHANLLSQIQHQLDLLLPPIAKTHCRLLNLRHGTLIIATDSAEWATHIRYASCDILQCIKENLGLTIDNIKCEIDPY